jgi:predicted nucleotidyltransferase component of viral defense system
VIPRNEANRFANVMGVDLHIAQQEIVLVYALEALAASGVTEHIAFKGGTYLRLMVTGDTGRLSEDLDFTNLDLPEDPRPSFDAAFASARHGIRFETRDPYRTEGRNWACTVGYAHEWDEGQFRLEVSYREVPFLPPRRWPPTTQTYFRALPFDPPPVRCLWIEEGLAEKLRAVQQRATERDLYDLVRYAKKGFDPALVRLLAVGKLWNDREPFDAERILGRLTEGRREWPEMERLVGRGRRKDWNRECAHAAERFAFLRTPTAFEVRLLEDVRHHALRGELDARLRDFVR